jgi:hypothetical protein
MRLNKIIPLVLLTFLSHSVFAQTWPIRETDDPDKWNDITGTFGEIHPTNEDHFHGAIDINNNTWDCPFYPVDDGIVHSIGNISVALRHNWPDGTQDYDRRTRYLHVEDDGIAVNGNVLTTTQLGTIENANGIGNHLHLEMWQFIDNQWYRLNPFHNDENWTLDVPDDDGDPQVNDVILEPLNEPVGIISGYSILNTGGAVTQFDNNTKVKVHLQDAPGAAAQNVFNENNDRLLVYGSIGSIVQTRDETINDDASDGAGLTVREIEYSIVKHEDTPSEPPLTPQQKYLIRFDKIQVDWYAGGNDFRDYNSIFHVPFNTNPPYNIDIYDDPGAHDPAPGCLPGGTGPCCDKDGACSNTNPYLLL